MDFSTKFKGPQRRQIIIIDLASSLCIYLSLYLETDNRRKYLLSFWESALADEIRADLITGNVNARWNQNIYLSLGKLVKQLFYTEFKFFKSAHNLRQLCCSDFKDYSVLFLNGGLKVNKEKMVVSCSVAGCSSVRGRGTESFFRFPVPCPLSWLAIVGRGGETINKYGDTLWTNKFYFRAYYLQAYTGFQLVWGGTKT